MEPLYLALCINAVVGIVLAKLLLGFGLPSQTMFRRFADAAIAIMMCQLWFAAIVVIARLMILHVLSGIGDALSSDD